MWHLDTQIIHSILYACWICIDVFICKHQHHSKEFVILYDSQSRGATQSGFCCLEFQVFSGENYFDPKGLQSLRGDLLAAIRLVFNPPAHWFAFSIVIIHNEHGDCRVFILISSIFKGMNMTFPVFEQGSCCTAASGGVVHHLQCCSGLWILAVIETALSSNVLKLAVHRLRCSVGWHLHKGSGAFCWRVDIGHGWSW